MNTQEKITALQKTYNSPATPEALKPRIFSQIEALKSQLENEGNPKPVSAVKPKLQKPKTSRKLKHQAKKYFAHRNIKKVMVLEDGQLVSYKGSDVLNGVNYFDKGGLLSKIATYVPVRNIVEVQLEDGTKIKPINGYYIKDSAVPVAESGAHLSKMIQPVNTDSDFDVEDFLQKMQPIIADVFQKNGLMLSPAYKITFNGKTYSGTVLFSKTDDKPKSIVIGYWKDNDIQMGSIGEIEFELDEREFHLRFPNFKINEVEMYANGGWTRDHKYLNKSEDYEVDYGKDKNRPQYMENGGPTSKMTYNEFKETLRLNFDHSKYEMFYLPTGHPYLGVTFNTKNKKTAYEDYLKMDRGDLPTKVEYGRKAKGITLDKIAEMHDVSLYFIEQQMNRGEKIEMEHTNDENIARAIAKDHLFEDPDYYLMLSRMENPKNKNVIMKLPVNSGKVNSKKPNNVTSEKSIKVPNLKRRKVKIYYMGQQEPNFKFIDDYRVTPDHFLKKDITIILSSGGEERIPEKLWEDFLNGKQTHIGHGENEIAIKLMKSKSKNPNRKGNPIFDLAKEIREPKEPWLTAVKRATKIISEKK